jgi:hypothetical protein
MSALLFLVGALLLVAAILDALWTVLWVDGGAGPIAGRFTSWLWRGLSASSDPRGRLLSLSGPIILSLTVLLWVLMMVAGWTLIFGSDPTSISAPEDGATPGWAGRVFYVAYSMFTMGNGDYVPRVGAWQVTTAVTTGTGMVLLTLIISYVLPVLSGVVQKRAFARSVHGLGETPERILESAWDGQDYRGLDLPLNALSAQLTVLSEQHKAYPLLHYYHAATAATATPAAVAVLDDALTLLCHGVPAGRRPSPAVLRSVRQSVGGYLETLASARIDPADEDPPPPDLDRLRTAGLPTLPDGAFRGGLADLRDRRRLLLGMVRQDGWHWLPHDR